MAMFTSSWITDVFMVLILFVTLVYFYMTRNFNYWKKRGIPYDNPVPMLGSFMDVALFRISPGEFLSKMYGRTKERYFGLFAFDQPYLLIRCPNLIKCILIKDFNYFYDRYVADNLKDDVIGTYNIFTMKNPEWKSMRTKLTPVFSSGKIKAMFQLLHSVGNEFISYLENDVVKRNSVEAKGLCSKYTTDVITSCVFGLHSNCLKDENAPFRLAGKKILTFTYSRAFQFLCYFFVPGLVKPLGLKFIDGEGGQFLKKVFNDSIDHRLKTGEKRNDVMDLLLEMKKNDSSIDQDKLVAQSVIFVTAGFESSSSVISFTLYEMCLNTEIQNKLKKEIKTVMAKHNGEMSYDCMQDMSYLNMVVSETLRKYPPLPFLDRRAMMDYKLPGTEIVIDKGTPVCISLLGLHYDPEYFPDPQRYDPERFSDTNKRNIVSGTYMPFGIGPHNCIGERFGLMSSKFGLIQILSKFEVERNDDTPEKLQLDPKGFLVTPKEGLHMRFKPIITTAA